MGKETMHVYDSGEFSEQLYVLFEKYFASRLPEDRRELVEYCVDSILEAYACSAEDGEDTFNIIGTLNDEGGRAGIKYSFILDVGRTVATRLSGKTPMQTMEVQQKEEE